MVAQLNPFNRLEVSVEDSGIGIPEDQQSKIFTMFGKLEDQTLNPQGCELGLSISTALVQRLGGDRIYVTSRPGSGSSFSFEISISSIEEQTPLYQLEIMTEIPDEYECSIRGIHPQSQMSTSVLSADVLVVDDAAFNRLVARNLVEVQGFTCVEACTGLQALTMLLAAHTQGKHFKLILMDIEMPEMDGLTATREIRSLQQRGLLYESLAIIGCSAYSSEDDKQNALSSGMNDYLEKPIARAHLFDLLKAHCSRPITHSQC